MEGEIVHHLEDKFGGYAMKLYDLLPATHRQSWLSPKNLREYGALTLRFDWIISGQHEFDNKTFVKNM